MIERLKKKTQKKNRITTILFTAGDRNRTGTGIATHGILSPGRLPVPPRRRLYQTAYAVMIKWDL